jgi:hypothetical protein
MRHPANCKNCGYTITGNFCEQCGQKASVSAITLQGILHEVFHYFTHLDKGFGYTLKKLITAPGTMQLNYLEGERTRHQKPFSMFFICGTLSGLGYYLVNVAEARIYGVQDLRAEDFYRHYFVVLQAFLLPLYTLITWLCFRNQKYNYAETLVMMLYSLSLVYLVLVPIVSLNLVFPGFDNRILEIVFLLFYITKTNLNFYEGRKWQVILLTLLSLVISYAVSQVFNELVMKLLQ